MSLLRHPLCLWNMLAIAAVAILLPSRNFCQKTNPDGLRPKVFKADSLKLPKPYLLYISVNGKKLMHGVSLGSAVPLQLGHHQNNLVFEFSSIVFGDPQPVRYRFRLQGFDKDWGETAQPSIRYTHLPPNKYNFQLLALHSDGHHAEQPLEWHFHILPPWWATRWAYLAYLLFAAATAYAFFLHKKKEGQMRHQLKMEHREAKRLQESDVFELFDILKKEEHTSLLRPAKTRLNGLEKGAGEPSYKEEMIRQHRKMLLLRDTLRARFSKESKLSPKDDRNLIAEEELRNKLLHILEIHYADEEFDTSKLCRALGMSRAQCYRKITALTGEPIGHLLRNFRLQKAKDLLTTSSLNISQVALEVGFKDLAHFSHCFHKHFGINASEIRKRDGGTKG
jgi:AraC-like DNA-binding protein